MGLTKNPVVGLGANLNTAGSGEFPVAPPAGPPPDPFRSETTEIEGYPLTTSIVDHTQAAFLPIRKMQPVIERGPHPSVPDELYVGMRPGVVARALLVEQVAPVPFDLSNVTIEAISKAIQDRQLVPVLDLHIGDGRRVDVDVIEEGLRNTPEFDPRSIGTGVLSRAVHIGTPAHFPIPHPGFPPRQSGEGMAVIGPSKGSDKGVQVGPVLYDGNCDFAVRGLSDPVMRTIAERTMNVGMWVAVDPDTNLGLMGRDNYDLKGPPLPPGAIGPLVIIETEKPFHSLPSSPLHTATAQEQLARFGLVETDNAHVAPSSPEPSPAQAPQPDGGAPIFDLPDLHEAPLGRGGPQRDVASLLDEQERNGFVTLPASGRRGGLLGRRKAENRLRT
jgi:hypothetical protein